MAPILSKVQPPLPRTRKEVDEVAFRKTRPLLEGFLEIVKESLETGHLAYSTASDKLNRFSDRLVTTTMWVLENYCCLDFNKFARGPEPKLSGSLPVMFCLMMLTMLYHAFVFVYMPATGIPFNSPTSLVFHAFTFMCLASFVQVARTDPGSVPSSAQWRTEGCPPPQCRENKQGRNEARWCRKSKAYKPDRAHFCRMLGRPVLRMDHHCPWVGNTVGWANHKFFYLFLTYTCASCSLLGWSFLQVLVHSTLPALSSFLLIGAEGLTLLLSAILVPFFLFHTWLLMRNMTTIEFCAKMCKKENVDKTEDGEDDYRMKSKYDIGVFNNFCAVMGDNPFLWFIPVGNPPGDGLGFPLREDVDGLPHLHARLGSAIATGSRTLVSSAMAVLSSSTAAREVTPADDPERAHPEVDQPGPSAEDEDLRTMWDNQEQYVDQGEAGASDGDARSQESNSTPSEGKRSTLSRNEAESFLGWSTAAEFVDDLRVGCITIEESIESVVAFVAEICSKQKVSGNNLRNEKLRRWVASRRRADLLCHERASDSSGLSSASISGTEFFSD